MVEVEINGEKKPCMFSALTAVLYEQEFRSDLYADLYAGFAVREDQADGKANALFASMEKVKTTTLYRVLWAGLKTADDEVQPFSEWAALELDFNRFEVVDQLLGECNRRCFRAGADTSE